MIKAVWLSFRQKNTLSCLHLEDLVATVHLKVAFDKVEDFILVFVPVYRRLALSQASR